MVPLNTRSNRLLLSIKEDAWPNFRVPLNDRFHPSSVWPFLFLTLLFVSHPSSSDFPNTKNSLIHQRPSFSKYENFVDLLLVRRLWFSFVGQLLVRRLWFSFVDCSNLVVRLLFRRMWFSFVGRSKLIARVLVFRLWFARLLRRPCFSFYRPFEASQWVWWRRLNGHRLRGVCDGFAIGWVRHRMGSSERVVYRKVGAVCFPFFSIFRFLYFNCNIFFCLFFCFAYFYFDLLVPFDLYLHFNFLTDG